MHTRSSRDGLLFTPRNQDSYSRFLTALHRQGKRPPGLRLDRRASTRLARRFRVGAPRLKRCGTCTSPATWPGRSRAGRGSTNPPSCASLHDRLRPIPSCPSVSPKPTVHPWCFRGLRPLPRTAPVPRAGYALCHLTSSTAACRKPPHPGHSASFPPQTMPLHHLKNSYPKRTYIIG
jgi:hypothetical protein